MHKTFGIFLFPIIVTIIGCKSEVDKCVDAQINAINPFSKYAQNYPTKEEVEAEARLTCLQASQGRQ